MRRALAAAIDVLVVAGLAPLPFLFAHSYDSLGSWAALLVVAVLAGWVGTVARALRGGVVIRALVFALVVWMLGRAVEGALSYTPGGSPLSAAWSALCVGRALPLALAAFLVGTRPRSLPLAAGLVIAGTGEEWPRGAVALVALGLADAGTRDWSTVRETLPSAGLGVLAGLVARGLATDVATTLVGATDGDLVLWGLSGWSVDLVEERVLRMAIELASLTSVVAFARGRTWGLLTVLPAAIALAVCARSLGAPHWFWGCMTWAHPFVGTTAASFLVPALVAVVPWAWPLAQTTWAICTSSAAVHATPSACFTAK